MKKRILEDYARRNGFTNIRHFTDDGVRGTTFKRPGLDAMVDKIRTGNVATVVVKDQSRMDGRSINGIARTLRAERTPIPSEHWKRIGAPVRANDYHDPLRETTRRTPKRSKAPNRLTGLLYCADCGSKLTHRAEYDEEQDALAGRIVARAAIRDVQSLSERDAPPSN